MSRSDERGRQDETAQTDTYEAPCVESVLTAEELEREVLYAGVVGTPPPAAAETEVVLED